MRRDFYRRKRLQKSLRRDPKSKKYSGYIRVIAPSIFSFSQNYDATVTFLQSIKQAAFKRPKTGHRKVFLDFETIEAISVGAALVLAAEIDRWQKIKNVKLVLKNYSSWSDDVKSLLHDIGFFALLGTPNSHSLCHGFSGEAISVLELISCDSANGERIAEISSRLSGIASAFEQDPVMYCAVLEAAYNGVLHGYPEKFSFQYPPLHKTWWATASWSPKEQTVKFIVYDQGVGISETLPRSKLYEKVVASLSSVTPVGSTLFKSDSTMIEAALKVSRTSRSDGHGQGLRDIVAPVESMAGAKLRILSGCGEVLYRQGEQISKRDRSNHIGGTLVEWTIPVGAT
ncbi:hypothetical protein EDD53_2674 [Pacificibacter maritimus]|uniref:STAS domain-containing protein n=1 Tax=Pacificibacter maritimus TaxID=762213 RepID=A0A3N4U7Y9_9RHOB|nr:hypothetical protein EDD53_2674 [Pacificibacter maritimus]